MAEELGEAIKLARGGPETGGSQAKRSMVRSRIHVMSDRSLYLQSRFKTSRRRRNEKRVSREHESRPGNGSKGPPPLQHTQAFFIAPRTARRCRQKHRRYRAPKQQTRDSCCKIWPYWAYSARLLTLVGEVPVCVPIALKRFLE
jgi:hypothetical protein